METESQAARALVRTETPATDGMSFFKELQERKVFRVASIYVVGMWIIIQVASDMFPAFGLPDWSLRLLYIVSVLGFPVAVILGWVYELTPEGVKRDDGDHPGAKPGRKRRVDFVIIGAVVMLGLFLLVKPQIETLITEGAGMEEMAVVEAPVEPEPLITHPQSIAVLAFANMSSNPDTEYFSDGISEEILNVLANIPGLQVSSRTSAFSFKGKDASIPDIARELEVSFVLEGSVRRADDTVRITAQLIDARTDKHVWSQTFDRELVQVFAIQDEIAGVIVDTLKPVVLAARGGQPPRAGTTTEDMVAYDYYLKGRADFVPDDEEMLAKSAENLEMALSMDPEFARAHSALARTLMAKAEMSGDEEMKTRAMEEAKKAVKMDYSLREAHEVLANP